MKNENETVYYKQFQIKDDIGVYHKCILAGVLITDNYIDSQETISIKQVKDKTIETITTWNEKIYHKDFYLGLSITNPTDKYDFGIGSKIARGRALKKSKSLGEISSDSRSMLGPEMIDTIMQQQMRFIEQNKDRFLKCSGPVVQPDNEDLPF